MASPVHLKSKPHLHQYTNHLSIIISLLHTVGNNYSSTPLMLSFTLNIRCWEWDTCLAEIIIVSLPSTSPGYSTSSWDTSRSRPDRGRLWIGHCSNTAAVACRAWENFISVSQLHLVLGHVKTDRERCTTSFQLFTEHSLSAHASCSWLCNESLMKAQTSDKHDSWNLYSSQRF